MATARDFTTCPICLQMLKSPKGLPCLHSFCEKCISEYIQRIDKKQKKKITSYPCPVCRTPILPTNSEAEVSKWGSLLPDNRVLSSSLIGDNEQSSDCNPCKRQKKSSAGVFWCRDCKQLMCSSCNDAHGSFTTMENHMVCSLENTTAKKYGIDISTISETCPVHSSKHIEAFCFDHKQLCCVSCLTRSHRKCNEVQTIDEIAETHKENSFQMDKVFPCLDTLIEKLVTEKQKQLELLNDSVESAKAKASKAVACAKDKLDCLLISFTKELSILQDNEKSAVEDELSQLDQVKTEANHLFSVGQFVCDEGTLVQQFIHGENVKSQMKNNIMSIINNLDLDDNTLLELELSSSLDEVCSLSDIGKLSVVKSRHYGEDLKYVKQHITTIRNLLGLAVLTAKYENLITLSETSLTCGAYLLEQTIAFRDRNSNSLCAKKINDDRMARIFSPSKAKRVASDKKRPYVLVVYVDGYIQILRFKNGSPMLTNVSKCNTGSLMGGIDVCENEVYVIVNDSVKKFKIDAVVGNNWQMTPCFKTNTDCSNEKLNGLAINQKTKQVIYTSKDNEIICTSLKGDEVFRIKDEAMKKPTSVSVHSSGYILVGDEDGSVHVISSDGKRHFAIIEKCQRITKLCDLWLDHSEQTLFLCGNEFIEMYRIIY